LSFLVCTLIYLDAVFTEFCNTRSLTSASALSLPSATQYSLHPHSATQYSLHPQPHNTVYTLSHTIHSTPSLSHTI
jgi:hypothetical protein